jgi:hypothetical protein
MSLETLCRLLGISEESTKSALKLEAWGWPREEILEDVAELKSKVMVRA